MDIALLQQHFPELLTPTASPPEDKVVVTGALDKEKVAILQQAGVEYVINLQPTDELTFDEQQALSQAGIDYAHVPIRGAEDLKQTVIMEFDKAVTQAHGKNTLMHCKSGNRVGAAVALRGGWLRERKMDTALEWGRNYGLTGLEEEVKKRLLVPQ